MSTVPSRRALRDALDLVSREEMQAVVEFLAHDLLEGRAPDTRGGRLAELYVRSVFKLLGLRPGHEDGYLQPFRMRGFTTRDLVCRAAGLDLRSPDDVMGVETRGAGDFCVEGDVVFAGFGIRTPLYGWDDFKSNDVAGRVLIVRANDPGHFDPALFEGEEQTFFGRWSCKVEEAQRAGAKAILVVHTDESAGYDWGVVRRSWGRENLFLPSTLENGLKFRGWIREESLRNLLSTRGLSLEALYRESLSPSFEPVPLGFPLRIVGRSSSRTAEAANVVAERPGRSRKRIVFSAHIDHLGVDPDLTGENVYNGAIDNGSAVAALVLAAKAVRAFPGELPYTVTFLACTAEESGLLGSSHFASCSDPSEIVASVNFELTPVWGRSRSVMGVGARFSTLGELLEEAAREEGLACSETSMSSKGFYFRSDHFPFARRGIPAIWVSAGEDFESGVDHFGTYVREAYHTVRDDFDPSWELEALRQTVRCALGLVEKIGASRELPRWKGRLTFPTEARREAIEP